MYCSASWVAIAGVSGQALDLNSSGRAVARSEMLAQWHRARGACVIDVRCEGGGEQGADGLAEQFESALDPVA